MGTGHLHFLSDRARGTIRDAHGLQEAALIDSITGSNAEAWSSSQGFAAARFRMFGFRILEEPGDLMTTEASRRGCSDTQ